MTKVTLIYFLLFILGISAANSQDFIKYNRFYLNDFEYNPSIAGIDNKTVGFLSTQKTWLGIDNSPTTQNFFIHSNANLLGLYKPKKFISSKAQKIGLGFSLYHDKNGPSSVVKVQLSLAYHVYLTNELKLSLGIGSELSQYSLNEDMLLPRDSNDPLLNTANENITTPNINTGLWLKNQRFHLGLSVMNLGKFSSFSDNYNFHKTEKTYFIATGYKFELSKSLVLEPNILFYSDTYSEFKFNSTIKLYYKDICWFGLGYTLPESFIIYTALKFRNFDFGYSFDYSTNIVYSNSNGNHMIFCGFKF